MSLLISSRARTVLTRFCETRCLACRVSLLVFCCCLCSCVIHAQIEKCSQVTHDDRRTSSRAVLLCLPTLEKRCVIFPHLVLRHVSCRAGFSVGVVFLTPGYRTDPRLVNSAKNKFVSAHVEPCESILLFGPRTRSSAKSLGFLTHTV